MAAISWSREFETGIGEIDDQHRRLVDLVNELHALPDDAARDRFEHLLESLIDYTLYHFAFEETLLEEQDYPLLDAHRQVHARFADQLDPVRIRFLDGEVDEGELTELVTAWLFNHIRNADTAAARAD